ncbi:BatA domain-containing protein [Pedobacter sp. L105]|uniref:BatA domain-containing protein n=1 Tax=Pedobacter sp. L105 TaxID=1641871 RepID=UPI00131C4F41|nr:BatA domain-containing protein [Pedobacter sp. L105]
MLQFLYPLGLLAAAGLIVPVVIHLWNIKNGKTLKVGSISLLGDPSNQRSRNFRVSDWPLLLLRILLILFIAFLLASPLFSSRHAAAEKAGWVLVEKQRFHELWPAHKKEFDSLRQKGYELRDFNTGFSKLDWKDTATVFSVPVPLSYFALIRQLNTALAPGTSVYLYTGNRLNRFEGTQPFTALHLKWKTIPEKTGELTWLAATYKLNKGGVRKVTAYSSATGDSYKTEDIKEATDTNKLQVLIFDAHQSVDEGYLKAAIHAIADFTQRDIQIKNINSLAQVTKSASLLFWLSDQELSPDQFKNLPSGISFFNYAGKKAEKVKSVLQYPSGTTAADLYQRTKFDGQLRQAIWMDGFGQPLLSLSSSAHLKHYQFYSRFNQNWTNLVWTNGLVMALLPIVIPHQEAEFGFPADNRSVRAVNVIPHPTYENKTAGSYFYEQKSLSSWFWWLVLILFFAERFITYRKLERKV